MRKINTPPYCRLQTKTKIRYKTFDKRLQPVTVLDHFKFDFFWHPAHDLRQLLTECRQELSRSIASRSWMQKPERPTAYPGDHPHVNFSRGQLYGRRPRSASGIQVLAGAPRCRES